MCWWMNDVSDGLSEKSRFLLFVQIVHYSYVKYIFADYSDVVLS